MELSPYLRERRGRFVRLRPLLTADAELTWGWRQGPRARFLNAGAATVEAQRAWIQARPGTELNFIIELEAGPPVGMLSLVAIDLLNRHAEPGRFLIGNAAAVRGVPAAVEAMLLLYELAFDELGVVRLWGTIAAENRQVQKWQQFLGMREEGRLRHHYFMDGAYMDAVIMGMLADEYRAVARPRMLALLRAHGEGKDH